MSDFGSLRIALSSLYAAQKGLEVTGNNIANAKTEGYSRETVVTTADGGPTIAAMYARWNAGGYGVKSVDVLRVNDAFLSNRANIEHAANGAAQESQRILGQLEKVFPEPGDAGIQKNLTDFWSAWDDVANQPADRGARTALLSQANMLLDKLHTAAAGINGIRDDAISRLGDSVSQINMLAQQISDLNKTIVAASGMGRSPNDLLDKRDLLIRKLSDYVGVTTRPSADGQLQVFIPGGPLVMETGVNKLMLHIAQEGVSIRYESGAGGDQSFTGGSVVGAMDSINETIPMFAKTLDGVANSVRDTVNAGLGVYRGGLTPADQNQSAAGTLQFGLSHNGAAAVTVSVTGADWSGLGGASALQSALQAAIDAQSSVAGKFSVVVTGGNGSPMKVSLATVDPADRFETSDIAGNVGNDRFFAAAAVSGEIATSSQDQTGTTLGFRVRTDGGAWQSVTVAGANWSGAGGAAALQSALNAALPAGITARVTGGNGSAMHVAISPSNSDQVLEFAAAYSGQTELPGIGVLLSNTALDTTRIGGAPFFTGNGALGLQINAAFANDPMRVAIGRPGAGAMDGGLATGIAESGNTVDGPDARYRALLGSLGAVVQRANSVAANQEAITSQVDSANNSVSGVNLDEEMIAMVQYQHAYAASARFLSAINDMLDTLINRVGR